ncbi:MAG: SIS domain-containing protein [Bdellovibrionia bacterium]
MREEILALGKRVLETEASGVLEMKSRIDEAFYSAVQLISKTQGKVIFTGIGKSGLIARKLASTFSSTGTPSLYLHPAESAHGDLGLIGKEDIVIAISYGGNSPELNPIVNFVTRKNIPFIVMTKNVESALAQSASLLLNIGIKEEACPLGLAPTTSTTATLALGDALAMCTLQLKGFKPQDFAEFHPGGTLGYKLLTKVQDVMHGGEALPLVELTTPIRQVLTIMTQKDVRGAAGVVDKDGNLVGVITDGDIRRCLEKQQDPLGGVAQDLMTRSPRTIDSNELAEKALFMMEQFRIQMVFVVDLDSHQPQKPVGILHIQDLLKVKIR